MRFLGADIHAFHKEWPPGPQWRLDCNEIVREDGSAALELDKEYDGRALGVVAWQGSGDRSHPEAVAVGTLRLEPGFDYDLEVVLEAWLRSRVALRTFVVQLTMDQTALFERYAAAHGWQVTS